MARCREVEERATQTLAWAQRHLGLLDVALDHLTLGRAALYRVVLSGYAGQKGTVPLSRGEEEMERDKAGQKGTVPFSLRENWDSPLQAARRELAAAVDGLRDAGRQDHLPRGLLSRAWLGWLKGEDEQARADLDEAWQIAERGSMRLFMADVLLHRARCFAAGPDRARALDDVAQARRLIDQCGYHRRDAELAVAEAALGEGRGVDSSQ